MGSRGSALIALVYALKLCGIVKSPWGGGGSEQAEEGC